jgi:hypothetical protein
MHTVAVAVDTRRSGNVTATDAALAPLHTCRGSVEPRAKHWRPDDLLMV